MNKKREVLVLGSFFDSVTILGTAAAALYALFEGRWDDFATWMMVNGVWCCSVSLTAIKERLGIGGAQ